MPPELKVLWFRKNNTYKFIYGRRDGMREGNDKSRTRNKGKKSVLLGADTEGFTEDIEQEQTILNTTTQS